MPETLGERIRRVRQERRLGLRETATKVGISAAYLSRIETGDEKNPPAEKVLKTLADLLEDDLATLMQLAGRVPEDVEKFVAADREMPEFLRMARERKIPAAKLIDMLNETPKKGDR